MVPFISKVRQVRDYGTDKDIFRIFDHNGTYIELTPVQFHELITAGWEALDRPDWSPTKRE